MRKLAETRYPIHELLRERWSPRAFADRMVEPDEKVCRCDSRAVGALILLVPHGDIP